MQQPSDHDRIERLATLRNLVQERLLYSADALFRYETSEESRRVRSWLGGGSDQLWRNVADLADQYKAICTAMEAEGDRSRDVTGSAISEDLLLGPTPNLAGVARIAAGYALRKALPVSVVLACIVYLANNWR